MSITAIHGDGARRLKYEYRPTTWISHGIQTLCGIQYHTVKRPGLFYRGWRYRVQQWCFRVERWGNRLI